MNKKALNYSKPTRETESLNLSHKALSSVLKGLVALCDKDDYCDHGHPKPVLSLQAVVKLIQQARRIFFPTHFSQIKLDRFNLESFLEIETTAFFENLSEQIILSCQDDCLRNDQPCTRCTQESREKALRFMEALPEIRRVLATDIRAALEGDPAAKSSDEVILSYPGPFAIMVYRLAHELYELEVPLLPRMMTEYAHTLTGIDIHPGAKIGKSFFVDHGTGVVVGESTEIGDRVRIYQGVTLGALSLPRDAGNRFRNKKRHPTIEDDVIIYSNATILGGEPVIGARSIIGGNVWLTESVPPDTKVLLKRPELVYVGNHETPTTKLGRVRRKGP
ncbi:MAG: serine acetyltransferase [Proteobacteria bacterium]|nr:serine acetyltransferase [Pseudomonadota bacterium]